MRPYTASSIDFYTHQWIAAQLNAGVDATLITDGLMLLLAHPVGSGDLEGKKINPDRAEALAIADALEAHNTGGDSVLPSDE